MTLTRFRFRFRFRFRVVWLFVALLILIPNLSRAQNVTVRGRVIEAGGTTRIAGAAVELTGVGNTFTDRNGLFAFSSVARGSYTLTLRALGYQSRQITLSVDRDTTLLLELEVAPVRVDSLVVEQRNYTLRGTVDDSHGRPVIDADVWADAKRAATNLAGSFKLKGIPAGAAVRLRVEAIGYQPIQLEVTAQRDTTVRFRLADDSLGLRMLAVQVDRLVRRSASTPYSRRQLDREWLARSAAASMRDYLAQMQVRNIRCLFIDDVEKPFADEMLNTYLPDEFERVEIIDKGTMVRLYTRRYVARLQSQEKLRPIVLIKMGRPMCQ